MRFAEKSWGNYLVTDETPNSLTVRLTMQPGKGRAYHMHKERSEVIVVVSGKGYAVIDGKKQLIKEGSVIQIPVNCGHSIFAESEMILIETQLGNSISSKDKYKLPEAGW